MSFKRIGSRWFAVLLFLFAAAACSSEKGANQETISSGKTPSSENESVLTIATTPVGSSFNVVGNGLASVISKNSDVKITVSPFSGVSAWGPQMDSGKIQLGIASYPEMTWAYKGEQGFNEMKNVRMLVRGNYLPTNGFVVRKDSGIKSVADLKGKRVASEYPGSASVVALLEAALKVNGLTWDDVKKVPTTTTVAGINDLRDDRLDAAYALTPTTPIMQEVHNSVPLYALNFLDNVKPDELDKVPQEIRDTISSMVPGAILTVVQPQGYITEPTIAAAYPSVAAVSAQLGDETVYKILETLWQHYEQLQPIHAWFKTWTPENMFDPNPTLPYHSGAVKFFKDKGLWNDEVEKIQQSLLK